MHFRQVTIGDRNPMGSDFQDIKQRINHFYNTCRRDDLETVENWMLPLALAWNQLIRTLPPSGQKLTYVSIYRTLNMGGNDNNELVTLINRNLSNLKNRDRIRYTALLSRIQKDVDSILDVGCARHDSTRRNLGNLHGLLYEAFPSAEIIGIDIIEQEIIEMQKNGYNVLLEDCQEMELNRKFDVILGGDIIEHLIAPGDFLDRSAIHLNQNGRLLLTTPNPDGFVFWRKALQNKSNNPTHTCWIDPSNLSRLVECINYSLKLLSWDYLPPNGGISSLLWKAGIKRGASPSYVAELGF